MPIEKPVVSQGFSKYLRILFSLPLLVLKILGLLLAFLLAYWMAYYWLTEAFLCKTAMYCSAAWCAFRPSAVLKYYPNLLLAAYFFLLRGRLVEKEGLGAI